jgi:Tetratricopeptide Repeats-Sensor
MTTPKQTCFVVMGFGEKVDFQSGRKLNLDAAYRSMIKPAVEEAGLECYRADEIVHSGVIDVPMYQQILAADVVIADLSTSNRNAFYELGVRHALRPYTTIIVAEDQFKFPFDLGHIVIRQYKHLGEDVGFAEVMRFRAVLKEAVEKIRDNPTDDSPVYTFLKGLRPPSLEKVMESAAAVKEVAGTPGQPGASSETLSVLMQQVDAAQKKSDFMTAKALLTTVRDMMRPKGDTAQENPYIVQRLALVTYKSKYPTVHAALEEARELLLALEPATSNDTETLGLWGAVHKRLWEETEDKQEGRKYLDEAIRGYERGFYLRNDYYNGINLAFLLNVRAAHATGRAEAIADFVQAQRIRQEVISICTALLQTEGLPAADRYWAAASLAEAYIGSGDETKGQQLLDEIHATVPQGWMKESTEEQMQKLRPLLADSPLKHIKTETV